MTRRHQPAISVILPVRNGMPHLARAIDSILAQTCPDFELLIIDDGSTDGSGDFVRSLHDRRIRLLSSGGRGLATALNLGLRAASAPYLARQDADDWSSPRRLAEQLAWLSQRPDVDILATAAQFVDADGAPLVNAWTATVQRQWDSATEPEAIAALMPLTCCLFHATVVARTHVLRRAGGYDPAMVPAEDYDLWLRLLPTTRFARLPEPLYTVRMHAASSSARRRAEQLDRVITAKLRYLRRAAPALAARPVLALPCADRGAAMVAPIARRHQFRVQAADEPIPPALVVGQRPDVVMVTDFTALEEWRAALEADGAYTAIGNLFVRRGRRGRPQRVSKPGPAPREAESAANTL